MRLTIRALSLVILTAVFMATPSQAGADTDSSLGQAVGKIIEARGAADLDSALPAIREAQTLVSGAFATGNLSLTVQIELTEGLGFLGSAADTSDNDTRQQALVEAQIRVTFARILLGVH